MGFVPLFHGQNWSSVLEGRLGWLVIIEIYEPKHRTVDVEDTIEPAIRLRHRTIWLLKRSTSPLIRGERGGV